MNAFKKPLFICSGNHDLDDINNQDWFNNISDIYSDNSIKPINGVTFGCIGYISPNFHLFKECEILLYHRPPSDTKVSINKNTNIDLGDKEVRKALEDGTIMPKFLLCGHMHYPVDTFDMIKNTSIYNTGVDKHSNIPNYQIIEI